MNDFLRQKFSIKDITNKISIFLVILSFFISIPIFSSNGRYVRFEDLVFVIVVLTMFVNRFCFNVKNNYSRSIVIAFFIYILFTTVNSIIRSFFGYLDQRFLLYVIKQIQYFTFGVYVYSYLLQNPKDNTILLTFRIGIAANLVYAVYQIVTGNFLGWYGVSAIGLDGASASSGALFFASGVYGLWEFIHTKKKTSLLIILFSMFAVMAVVSRTFIMGYAFFCFANLILFSFGTLKKIMLHHKITISAIIVSAFIAFSTLSLVFQSGNVSNLDIYLKLAKRVSKIDGGANIRMNNYLNHISKWQKQPTSLLWGTGWSGPEYIRGESAIGIDGQYVRLVIETGIFGLIIFIYLLFCVGFTLRGIKNNPYKIIGLVFFFSFLIMAITYDVFVISKTASFFWIFLSMMFGYSKMYEIKKGNYLQNHTA